MEKANRGERPVEMQFDEEFATPTKLQQQPKPQPVSLKSVKRKGNKKKSSSGRKKRR